MHSFSLSLVRQQCTLIAMYCSLDTLDCLTFTFQALAEETIQESSTVVTKRWMQIVVDFESMWHVNVEAGVQILKHGQKSVSNHYQSKS